VTTREKIHGAHRGEQHYAARTGSGEPRGELHPNGRHASRAAAREAFTLASPSETDQRYRLVRLRRRSPCPQTAVARHLATGRNRPPFVPGRWFTIAYNLSANEASPVKSCTATTLNNVVEQHYPSIKRRIRPRLSFKSFWTGRAGTTTRTVCFRGQCKRCMRVTPHMFQDGQITGSPSLGLSARSAPLLERGESPFHGLWHCHCHETQWSCVLHSCAADII
jgi:hypothetical protein